MKTYYVGIDVGSSSVKTSIFDARKGKSIGRAVFPAQEQIIDASNPGWAEQDPEMWWEHFKAGYTQIIRDHKIPLDDIAGFGISYQMHGLVALDSHGNVLRKSIIWCDSRAEDIGSEAFNAIGQRTCLASLLNSPGNFTASKLSWVKTHEPKIYAQIHKFMLPGDYIAFRLTGEMTTTASGLSEAILWDFPNREISTQVLNHFGIDKKLVPDLVPTLGHQGTLSRETALELGLSPGVTVTYRAGDQPNNAFSLNVLEPGQVAATAGTSGVVYAVSDQDVYDERSRINTFLHVNDRSISKRNGILICVNGTGILYSWLKRLFNQTPGSVSYEQMNANAQQISAGADGLQVYPFGNGSERLLEGRHVQASIEQLDFNRHHAGHLIRAGMEGIIFSLNLGFDLLGTYGVPLQSIRAGHSNMFLSPTFRSIFATVTNTEVRIFDTDGADGAARGAALGAGFYDDASQTFESLKLIDTVAPDRALTNQYFDLYSGWKEVLDTAIHELDRNHTNLL